MSTGYCAGVPSETFQNAILDEVNVLTDECVAANDVETTFLLLSLLPLEGLCGIRGRSLSRLAAALKEGCRSMITSETLSNKTEVILCRKLIFAKE